MYIRDNQTSEFRKYGSDCHDSLVISDDGNALYYYNLQNGDGSQFRGYVFCDENGKTPEESDFFEDSFYFDIGGKSFEKDVDIMKHDTKYIMLVDKVRQDAIKQLKEVIDKYNYNCDSIYQDYMYVRIREILKTLEKPDEEGEDV